MIRQALRSVLIAGMIMSMTFAPTPVYSQADDEWLYVDHCLDDELTSGVAGVSSDNQPVSGKEGKWSTPGTQQYGVAKLIFDTLTDKYGTSGAFAAGVIGNLIGESGFIEDAAEIGGLRGVHIRYNGPDAVPSAGRAGGVYRFGMNNRNPVRGMAYYPRSKPFIGGGGLFQETPYTKFTNTRHWQSLHPDGWSAANQIAFVVEDHFWHPTYNAKPYTFRGTKFSPLRTVAQALGTNDPVLASIWFQAAELRPYRYHPERETWAVQANLVFNQANIQADPSKWRLGSAGNGDPDENPSSSLSGLGFLDECRPVKQLKTINDPGAGQRLNLNDYVGDHGMAIPPGRRKSIAKHWKDLPDNLKQYAIDLSALGVPRTCDNTWWRPLSGGKYTLLDECVILSKVAMRAIWKPAGSKDLLRPWANPNFRGNGGAIAYNAAPMFGTKVSKTPSKGAMFSHTSRSVGHTGVVSHVFANGDVLIIEQNSGLSGETASTRCDWNYAILTNAYLQSRSAVFMTPPKPAWELNSLLRANQPLSPSPAPTPS